MKRTLLILSFVALLVSCSYLQTGKEAWLACQHNAECLANAKASATQGKSIGETVGASIPVPGGAMAGALLGWGLLFSVSMIKGGLGLIKKKEEEVPHG